LFLTASLKIDIIVIVFLYSRRPGSSILIKTASRRQISAFQMNLVGRTHCRYRPTLSNDMLGNIRGHIRIDKEVVVDQLHVNLVE
jgi:hypothetical protein